MPPLEKRLMLLEQKFDQHIEAFDRHRTEEEARWEHLIEITEQNAKISQTNAESIENLATSTHDMVEAWNNTNGAIKVGAAIGQFLKWVSGFAVVGYFIAWAVEHFGTK